MRLAPKTNAHRVELEALGEGEARLLRAARAAHGAVGLAAARVALGPLGRQFHDGVGVAQGLVVVLQLEVCRGPVREQLRAVVVVLDDAQRLAVFFHGLEEAAAAERVVGDGFQILVGLLQRRAPRVAPLERGLRFRLRRLEAVAVVALAQHRRAAVVRGGVG